MISPTQQTLFNRLKFDDLISLFPTHIRARFYDKKDVKTCKAGGAIFRRGEPGPWFGTVLSGRVRLCVRPSGEKEMMLSMVERGEVFGERAFFEGSLRAGDAVADEDTTYIVIAQDEFLPLLFDYPEAMFNIIKILCRRINGYINMMELYALQDLEARLAQVLLYLAQKFGRETGGRMVVHAGLNQSDLAQLVGSSRERVNKQLKAMVAKGCIAIEADDIVLLDRPQLERMTASAQAR